MPSLPAPMVACLEAFSRLARLEIWPGFDPLAYPLVLHSKEGVWLVGHPAPPEGYVTVGEVTGRPVAAGKSLPGIAANTAAEVGGVLCAMAALPTAEQNPETYARLLLHECFHAYQTTVLAAQHPGDPALFAFMSHYPENDPAHNAMARIENRLLAAALADAPGAAAAFAAVRQVRWKRQDGRLRAYETFLEYTEGTATYSEFRAGRPLADLPDLLGACNIGGKWAAYRRFYFTGAAQAVLLDQVLPGWQCRFAAEPVTLYGLLCEGIGQALPDGEAVVAAEGYTDLLAAEERHEANRRREIERLLTQLQEGPGMAVHVRLPAPGAYQYGWDPTRMLLVEPGLRLHTRWFSASWPNGCEVEVERLCLEDQRQGRLTFRLPAAPVVSTAGGFRLEGEHVRGLAPTGTVEHTEAGWWVSMP